MSVSLKKDLCTDCGMWGVWDYETYREVDDYDKWEPLFCEDEDIIKQIEKNTFVPANIFEDGCVSFTVKLDEGLNEREAKYVCVQSEQYLFKSNGKTIVSGIEYISNQLLEEYNCITLELPQGYYSVQVCLISWDDEPDAFLADGAISPDALSDFVILIKSNANVDEDYRKRINTFSEDDE